MSNLDSAIRQNRTVKAVVNISHNGAPLANQEIQLEQKTHQFLFGGNWGESTIALANGEISGHDQELAEQRNHYFLQVFNQVTLPFYWAGFEPQQGQPKTQRILNTAHWYKDHGCVVKGHPLSWHTLAPDWLLSMNNQQVLQTQLARIRRDVSDFAGVIDMWDVINEAVIMPIFDKYDNALTRLCKEMGRINLIRALFDEARATNPNAILLLNDFDTSPAFDILVEGCTEADVLMDVIGIQSHMHQGYWGVEKTQRILERFERFNMPIHFTETTILSGDLIPRDIVDLNDFQVLEWPSTPEGEARQTEEVILHYKTLMAHPLVEAITWWDMTDGNWLNAPSGLLRADETPKPAYDELLKLVKGEWWVAPTTLTTDDQGRLSVAGFAGEYELSTGNQSARFGLDKKGAAELSVEL